MSGWYQLLLNIGENEFTQSFLYRVFDYGGEFEAPLAKEFKMFLLIIFPYCKIRYCRK